jgi:hypothetical protein
VVVRWCLGCGGCGVLWCGCCWDGVLCVDGVVCCVCVVLLSWCVIGVICGLFGWVCVLGFMGCS